MRIENGRLGFPVLFQAQAFQEGQTPKFSATIILAKTDPQIQQIQQAMWETAQAKWGEQAQQMWQVMQAQQRLALRDGAEKADKDGFGNDVMFFNASNTKRPGVYDRDRTPLTQQDGRPYAGCYCNFVVEFWSQDNQYGKRINASLRGVQFVKDGEAFGGGAGPAEADDFPELNPDPQSGVQQAPWEGQSGPAEPMQGPPQGPPQGGGDDFLN